MMMRAIIGLMVLAAVGCGDAVTAPAGDAERLRLQALAAGLRPLDEEPIRPVDNPYLPARVDLGHTLFFDPILSGPLDVACSTCHLPRLGFADGRQFPSGAGGTGLGPDRTSPEPAPLRLMPRNSPTVFNIGLYGRFGTEPTVSAMMFWNGSAFGLEDQVLNPISADNELRGLTYSKVVAFDSVVARLRSIPEYVTLFGNAFPMESGQHVADPAGVVTTATLRLALAAYLRELVTPRAPLDEFLRGDTSALDPLQRQGLALFIGSAGCADCHTGALLSDFDLHVVGVRQEGIGRDTTPGDDLGWGEHGGAPYSFRTPPLRQVGETAPYFHAGTAATLDDVVAFKVRGRSEHPRVRDDRLDPAMRPLELDDAGIRALVAFLHALTDRHSISGPLFLPPSRVPSGLVIPQ